MSWWRAYNTTKHDRYSNYSEIFEIKDWITRDRVLKKEEPYSRNDEINDMFK